MVALAPHGARARVEDVHRAVTAPGDDQRSVWRPSETVAALAAPPQATGPLAVQAVPDRCIASCRPNRDPRAARIEAQAPDARAEREHGPPCLRIDHVCIPAATGGEPPGVCAESKGGKLRSSLVLHFGHQLA